MSKERLEEIIDAIAYLRDEYVDTEMVSEYYGHDIKAEIFSCPISALSYTGDYIELLQKRVQELERKIDRYREALTFYAEKSNYDYDVKVDSIAYVGDQSDMKFYMLDSAILYDKGATARKALEGEE